MPEGVLMLDRMYFSKPEWLNQAREGGFTRAAAWLDLLALTNQDATTSTVRGISVPVERGECHYSKLGLSVRWGRSQSWVTTTLAIWEKDGRVQIKKTDNETTVIFVTNFDAWQTGLREQSESKSGAEREQNARAARAKRDREGEGEGPEPEPRGEGEGGDPAPGGGVIPSDEDIREFCSRWPGDLARGIPATIPEVWWSGWVSNRLLNEKKWPRDWQRVLVLAWRADVLNRHPKALAALAAVNGGSPVNGSPLPNWRMFELRKELDAVRERLDAAYETNTEPVAADVARETELEGVLQKL